MQVVILQEIELRIWLTLTGIEGFTGREVYFSDPGVDNNKRFAREQLQANKAEITAWLAVNYAGIVTDTNAFEKEIGYAIDAASYDVQYGGNSQPQTQQRY